MPSVSANASFYNEHHTIVRRQANAFLRGIDDFGDETLYSHVLQRLQLLELSSNDTHTHTHTHAHIYYTTMLIW
jgi:hypothetical protein